MDSMTRKLPTLAYGNGAVNRLLLHKHGFCNITWAQATIKSPRH
jgi:hypothetical protein